MISAPLLSCFQDHAAKLRDRARAKREAVALKHVVDDPDVREEATDDANLGRRLPGERFAGDTALRTLNTLLAMVDARGFERCTAHACALPPLPAPPRTTHAPLGPGRLTKFDSTRR